jgi:hypothetical protein
LSMTDAPPGFGHLHSRWAISLAPEPLLQGRLQVVSGHRAIA